MTLFAKDELRAIADIIAHAEEVYDGSVPVIAAIELHDDSGCPLGSVHHQGDGSYQFDTV